MSKRFKLHMLVEDGHLRIMPKGDLAFQDVNVILGAARSALRVFPVLIVDLVEVRELAAEVPDLLEDGLRSLITEQKSVLRQQMPHLSWKVYQPAPPHPPVRLPGQLPELPVSGGRRIPGPQGQIPGRE